MNRDGPDRGAVPLVPVLGGLAELAGDYDGFILDMWGVVHGGVEPYPGVLDALEQLAEAGKPAVLLSNAPRRAATAGRRLREIGVPDRLYRDLVTSGEAAHEALRERSEPHHARLGRRYFYIGPAWDSDLVRDLDYAEADRIEDADFILCVGLFDESDPLQNYDSLFQAAAGRTIPMVCVNPDLVVHRQSGVTSPCAGLLGQRFEERHGGRVLYHGKPDPKIFHLAAARLGLSAGVNVLMVGDSLTTDIQGATAAGMASLFVTRGIFAEQLGIEPGEEPDPEAVSRLCARHGQRPVAALATLRW